MSHPDYANLTRETAGRIHWITVNRPDKLNALDRRTVAEIADAVRRAIRDPEVGVLVVTGQGPKAFVAGADIAEMAALDAGAAQEFSHELGGALAVLEGSPAIAAVNGFALGAVQRAACHLAVRRRRGPASPKWPGHPRPRQRLPRPSDAVAPRPDLVGRDDRWAEADRVIEWVVPGCRACGTPSPPTP
jgi:hypothetical protein